MCAEPRRRRGRRSRGFTLIEAVVAIVVVGVALTGVLMAVREGVRGSADPVLQRQLLGVAQQVLEDIELQPYAAVALAAQGMPSPPGYAVQVSVSADTLGGSTAALRITVTATRGRQSLSLSGWRTDHAR